MERTRVTTDGISNNAVTYAKIQTVSATDRILGRSSAGAGTVEEIVCTSFARTVLDDADAATARTTLGLTIGTNVQAYDAELAALAGVTSAADTLAYFTGSGTATTTTLSSFGRSLIDDADAAAARTTLSVQPTASPAFTGAATFANTGDVVPLTVTNTGTANSFVVNDASGDTTPFVIDASGNVGIKSDTAAYSLQIAADSENTAADNYIAIWGNVAGSNGTTGGVRFFNRQSNTSATPARQIAGVYAGRHGDNFGGSLTFLTSNAATGTQTLATRLTIDSTGTATFAGQVLVTAGSVSACSVAPSGDANTGLTFPAADNVAWVTGGVERMRIGSNGRAQFFANDEKYGIQINKGATGNGPFIGSDGADILTVSTAGGAERMRIDASGNVGIGTGSTSLAHTLNCNGEFRLLGTGGSTEAGKFHLYYASASNRATITTGSSGQIIFEAGTTSPGSRAVILEGGNFGIGTTSPDRKLVVSNGGAEGLEFFVASAANVNTINSFNRSGGVWNKFAVGCSTLEFFVGSGATSAISVDSNAVVTMAGVYDDIVGGTNRDLFIDSTGKLGYVSSIRASKTDIESLDDVSWLSALTPVSYRYRKRSEDGTYSEEADGVTDYGLIAEDVEAVRPELCFYDDVDGEPELRGVTYSKLITPMLRYIQQLDQRIAALEERLNHA